MKPRLLLLVAAAVVAVILGGTLLASMSVVTPYGLPEVGINVTLPASLPYRQITTGSWDDRNPVYSPNGSLIAYVSDRGGFWGVWVMKSSGASQRKLTPDGVMAMYPQWSPDSSAISYWFMNGLTYGIGIFNLTANRTILVTPSYMNAFQGPANWSPDGSRVLFYAMGNPPQLVMDDASKGSLTVLANATGSSLDSAWVNSTTVLYTSTDNGTSINMLDLRTGASTPYLSFPGFSFIKPSVGFNGSIVYFSNKLPDLMSTAPYVSYSYGYDLWVQTLSNSTATFQYVMADDSYRSGILIPVPFVPGIVDSSYTAQWNNNATKLLYVCDDPVNGYRMWIWDVTHWTSASVAPTRDCNVREPVWSPDGSQIAFSSDLSGQYHIYVTNLSGVSSAPSSIAY